MLKMLQFKITINCFLKYLKLWKIILGSNVDNEQTTSNLDKDVNGVGKSTRDINAKDIFVSHIDNSSIERMFNEVDRISGNREFDNDVINTLINEISAILTDAAEQLLEIPLLKHV